MTQICGFSRTVFLTVAYFVLFVGAIVFFGGMFIHSTYTDNEEVAGIFIILLACVLVLYGRCYGEFCCFGEKPENNQAIVNIETTALLSKEPSSPNVVIEMNVLIYGQSSEKLCAVIQ